MQAGHLERHTCTCTHKYSHKYTNNVYTNTRAFMHPPSHTYISDGMRTVNQTSMCACIHTYMHPYSHTGRRAYINTISHARMIIHTCTQAGAHTHKHPYTYTYINKHMNTHITASMQPDTPIIHKFIHTHIHHYIQAYIHDIHIH